MVEGPGCKLKSETMKRHVLKQRIIKVMVPNSQNDCDSLKGLSLIDVQVLGKELFMIFEKDKCLRLHFLMNGTILYHKRGSQARQPPKAGARGPRTLTFCLEFERTVMTVYDSSFQVRSASECLEKYQRLTKLDVCSPVFLKEMALVAIREEKHAERLICDVIMDQEVAPGLGNIIKNEALFDSGVQPITKVKDLTDEILKFLIVAYVQFSEIFYQMRKTCRPLQSHFRIYNKQHCSNCMSTLTKCKPGEYKRPTWFCVQCQTNVLGIVPPRNTCLGAAKRKQTITVQPEAKCRKMTDFFSGSPSAPLKTSSMVVATPVSACDAYDDESDEERGCKERVVSSFSPKTGSLLSPRIPPCQVKPMFEKDRSSTTPLVTGVRWTSPIFLSRMPSTGQAEGTSFGNKPKEGDVKLCQHNLPVKETYVVKAGDNKNRIFHSCQLPRGQQCNYFEWADISFPQCNHKIVATRRTVLKVGPNNGRGFYCCRMEKESQCGFFQWCDS